MKSRSFALSTLALLGAAAVGPALGQAAAEPAPVTFGLSGGVQLVLERDPFWGLAQTYSPASDYKRDFVWTEAFVRPSMTASKALSSTTQLYGGASLIASASYGEDVFQQKNKGRLLVEEAYAGLKGQLGKGAAWDISAGARSYALGHGLLLSAGAGNGFERGAAISAPRTAWAMTGLASISAAGWTAQAFYLDPNELKSSDTNTRLAGARVEWAPSTDGQVGLAHFKVLASSSPYPQAPIQIIENGRDGLRTTDFYWTFEPKTGALAGLSFKGEAALQTHARIDLKARGLGMEVAYRIATAPFAPRLSYSYRQFSGDKPETAGRLERFDGLYYAGAPDTWSSGGNGSFAFYNSNLSVHRLRVELVLSQRDFVNLNYWKTSADQANSPLQFGQAARLTTTGGTIGIVTGAPVRALTEELYFEHTRVLNQNLFLTWGVAMAFPKAGVKAMQGTGAKDWYGGFVNLAFRY